MSYHYKYNEKTKDIMFQAVKSKNGSSTTSTPPTEERPPGNSLKSPLFPPVEDSDPLQEVLIILMELHKRVIRIEEKLSYLEYNLVLK